MRTPNPVLLACAALTLLPACADAASPPAATSNHVSSPAASPGTVPSATRHVTTSEPTPSYLPIHPAPSIPRHGELPLEFLAASHLRPDQKAVAQAWVNFRTAVLTSLDPADPRSTSYDAYAVPERARRARQHIETWHRSGYTYRVSRTGGAQFMITDVTIRDNRARVQVCQVIDDEEVRNQGRRVITSGPVTTTYREPMIAAYGRWLVPQTQSDSYRAWMGDEMHQCLAQVGSTPPRREMRRTAS